MKFYFNCNNSTQADLLKSVGVKHIMISYRYVKKPYEGFESIMATPGKGADPFQYYQWVEEQGKNITALQWDDPTNIENNKIWYDKGAHLGIIPVIHGDWFRSIQRGEFEEGKLIALGRLAGKIEEDETLKKLPTKYIYHGLGKGRWTKNKSLQSVDSSTWLSGVRGRKTDVFQRESLTFGKKGQGDRGRIQIALDYHKAYAKKVGLDLKALQAGEYEQLMKATISLYYMPMFKSLGIYEDNFSSDI
jgi:hypothetical protein